MFNIFPQTQIPSNFGARGLLCNAVTRTQSGAYSAFTLPFSNELLYWPQYQYNAIIFLRCHGDGINLGIFFILPWLLVLLLYY